jgi:hypothetical protein
VLAVDDPSPVDVEGVGEDGVPNNAGTSAAGGVRLRAGRRAAAGYEVTSRRVVLPCPLDADARA